MALFPNVQAAYKFKGKTHTNLVVSEGMAPAEHFIISRTNTAKPFIYEYGEEGNQTVVLAKGKIVEVVGSEYDHDTAHYKTAVKQATNGTTKAIGVNFHNVYARRRDGMHSTITKPTVITRNYIEVPLFETTGTDNLEASQALAEAMKFGAAVSETKQATTKIEVGDYVVSDRSGNFRKYVKNTDAPEAIVGQVLAKETELPPAGFLQYYQELVNPEMEEYFKLISQNTPSPGAGKDPLGAYPYGAPYTHKGWKPEFEKMLANARLTGIPFLTDGFFRAQETRTFDLKNKEEIEVIRPSDAVEVLGDGKVKIKKGTRNAALFIKLKHKIDATRMDNVQVTIDSDKLNAQDIHVDVYKNTIVLYLPENLTDSDITKNAVSLTVPMVVDPIAGIPTEWDYKGSTGAVRILLQK